MVVGPSGLLPYGASNRETATVASLGSHVEPSLPLDASSSPHGQGLRHRGGKSAATPANERREERPTSQPLSSRWFSNMCFVNEEKWESFLQRTSMAVVLPAYFRGLCFPHLRDPLSMTPAAAYRYSFDTGIVAGNTGNSRAAHVAVWNAVVTVQECGSCNTTSFCDEHDPHTLLGEIASELPFFYQAEGGFLRVRICECDELLPQPKTRLQVATALPTLRRFVTYLMNPGLSVFRRCRRKHAGNGLREGRVSRSVVGGMFGAWQQWRQTAGTVLAHRAEVAEASGVVYKRNDGDQTDQCKEVVGEVRFECSAAIKKETECFHRSHREPMLIVYNSSSSSLTCGEESEDEERVLEEEEEEEEEEEGVREENIDPEDVLSMDFLQDNPLLPSPGISADDYPSNAIHEAADLLQEIDEPSSPGESSLLRWTIPRSLAELAAENIPVIPSMPAICLPTRIPEFHLTEKVLSLADSLPTNFSEFRLTERMLDLAEEMAEHLPSMEGIAQMAENFTSSLSGRLRRSDESFGSLSTASTAPSHAVGHCRKLPSNNPQLSTENAVNLPAAPILRRCRRCGGLPLGRVNRFLAMQSQDRTIYVPDEQAELLMETVYMMSISFLVLLRGRNSLATLLSAAVQTTSLLHWSKPRLGFIRVVDIVVVQIGFWYFFYLALFKISFPYNVLWMLFAGYGILCYFLGLKRSWSMDLEGGTRMHRRMHLFGIIANTCLGLGT